jgi:ankyrin repeat protein
MKKVKAFFVKVSNQAKMNTGPVNPQLQADKFLCVFNAMAREGHIDLARKLTGLCRATRESDNLWDDINYSAVKAKKNHSPLSYAISNGDMVRVEFLLKHGADNVFYDPYDTRMPLIHAIRTGSVEMINLLVSYGAAVDYIDTNAIQSINPLLTACTYDNAAVVATLLDLGAKIDNGDDLTPLMVACEYHNIAIIRLLCSRGAAMDVIDQYGYTLLMQAIHKNHAEIVEELCRLGANVNQTNSRGSTALMEACKDRGNYRIADTLCYYDANVNAVDNRGWTALLYAAKEQNFGLVALLLDYGADVNAVNNEDQTAITLASKRRRWRDDCDDEQDEVIDILVSYGATY